MTIADVMFLIGWIAVIILVTFIAFKYKFQWLLLVPMLFWFALSIWCWNRTDINSPTQYDVYWIVRYVSIVMAVATIAIMGMFRTLTGKNPDAEPLDESEAYKQEQQAEWDKNRRMGRRRKKLPPPL